ncbi:Crp/Fnr family transcriptional regulator [Pedobacter sp.]|jgi:CRP-like cAMP-binding protein|uniref:Crp/Fnr family transcriptional regulator n=1 Tax=Pedobacter sp. TaxID=1411316 RepID=UPI002C24061C|nr:Crp/Fnr family transcriptional regulator [Pedobacter sp.]HEV3222387.1 Crp/Fnr family transcriptional regulator [Puia sp.]HWW39252.1 Crp/Fnr family transcriptional regulator [Pedobacter sp.]
MDLIDIVKSYLSNYVTLNEQEFSYLSSLFELRNFQKREKLVEEGEVEKYLNFILQGLARKYFIRKNEEMVMQFSRENEIICCYDSFNSCEPSNFSVEALEDMVVVSITLENIEKLYEFSPKMERLGRLIATQEYLKKESLEYNRVRLTSQERFINFIRNNGYLMQRVPQKYLASYLNMKPETFSRLKHLIKKPS